MYKLYCTNFKECLDGVPYDAGISLDSRVNANGKSRFAFDMTELVPEARWDSTAGILTREELVDRCKNQAYYVHYACTDLLVYDNFEIKDDYPMW